MVLAQAIHVEVLRQAVLEVHQHHVQDGQQAVLVEQQHRIAVHHLHRIALHVIVKPVTLHIFLLLNLFQIRYQK